LLLPVLAFRRSTGLRPRSRAIVVPPKKPLIPDGTIDRLIVKRAVEESYFMEAKTTHLKTVKPLNHLILGKQRTSTWHTSFAQFAKLDTESKKTRPKAGFSR
jgi:hypothetical protein